MKHINGYDVAKNSIIMEITFDIWVNLALVVYLFTYPVVSKNTKKKKKKEEEVYVTEMRVDFS